MAASTLPPSHDTESSGDSSATNADIESTGGLSYVVEEPTSKSRRVSARQTLLLAFGSLGAVYGDIGTSPLYVLDSIKLPQATPTPEDVYGCVSIVFWLFVIIVFFKYTLIVLVFGPNQGEGGQVAIYAKIARSLGIGPRGVHIPGATEKPDLELMQRVDTLCSANVDDRPSWKRRPIVLKCLSYLTLGLCFLGCALVMSDGLLTPTTTALTAVSGIQVAVPSFNSVLAVSEVVVIVLFAIQYLGSSVLSLAFAPIMFVWLIGLAFAGIYNIARYDPGVFKSLSPHYAIKLLKKVGIDCLGGGMLAITGTEAMFADVGHFGRLPIQIGITFTMICLMLTYLGQGAYLVHHPQEIASVFYTSMPGGVGSGFYWFMFVLAILSTIVASQALILGVFSILTQLINLDCFPRLKIVRLSRKERGKVYVPVANFLLLVGVCATMAGFQNSNNVTAAYGLGISLDFCVTSILMFICMLFVYNMFPLIPVLFVCIFMPLEMCLVISNCKKVPHGAWFPLMMCGIFIIIFSFWRYCRDRTVYQQVRARNKLPELFPEMRNWQTARADVLDLQGSNGADPDDIQPAYVEDDDEENGDYDSFNDVSGFFGRTTLKVTSGVAFIYSDTPDQDVGSPNTVSSVYARILGDFASLPSVIVFCTVRTLGVPNVSYDDRIFVAPSKIPGHYKASVRFGFLDEIRIDDDVRAQVLKEIPDKAARMDPNCNNVLHIFEKNTIRCRVYSRTRNPFKLAMHYARQVMIDTVFSPINSVFQNDDHHVVMGSHVEEVRNKLFVGGVLDI